MFLCGYVVCLWCIYCSMSFFGEFICVFCCNEFIVFFVLLCVLENYYMWCDLCVFCE